MLRKSSALCAVICTVAGRVARGVWYLAVDRQLCNSTCTSTDHRLLDILRWSVMMTGGGELDFERHSLFIAISLDVIDEASC